MVTVFSPATDPNPPEFVAGLDLGQANDYTALCILSRRTPRPTSEAPKPEAVYSIVHLQRWRGEPYPSLVSKVKAIASDPRLRPAGSGKLRVAVDATGVGRAVVDMFVNAGMPVELHPVSIHGGSAVRSEGWAGADVHYHVPKKDLCGVVQACLSSGRLKHHPDLPMGDLLAGELLNFRVTINSNSHESFGAWREADHDDLVLGLALGLWLAESRPRVEYRLYSLHASRMF